MELELGCKQRRLNKGDVQLQEAGKDLKQREGVILFLKFSQLFWREHLQIVVMIITGTKYMSDDYQFVRSQNLLFSLLLALLIQYQPHYWRMSLSYSSPSMAVHVLKYRFFGGIQVIKLRISGPSIPWLVPFLEVQSEMQVLLTLQDTIWRSFVWMAFPWLLSFTGSCPHQPA